MVGNDDARASLRYPARAILADLIHDIQLIHHGTNRIPAPSADPHIQRLEFLKAAELLNGQLYKPGRILRQQCVLNRLRESGPHTFLTSRFRLDLFHAPYTFRLDFDTKALAGTEYVAADDDRLAHVAQHVVVDRTPVGTRKQE